VEEDWRANGMQGTRLQLWKELEGGTGDVQCVHMCPRTQCTSVWLSLSI
jgi:hypothetical protein